MRKLLLSVAVVGLLAGAGCGGDDGDEESTGEGGAGATTSSSTTASTTAVPGDPSSTTVTTTAGDPTATTGAAPLEPTPIDPATVETLPPAPDPGPVDPGFPPAAPGRYTYATTGTAAGRPVDGTQEFTVTSLGPGEIRYAAREQVLDLQYRPDGVYLRQLVATFGTEQLRFQSADGVLLIPIPQDPGRTWDWQLTDVTGGLTAAWHGSTEPSQAINAGGGVVQASVIAGTIAISGQYTVPVLGRTDVDGRVDLRLWIDPALRLPVQLRQVTVITKPVVATGFGGDTTSTYTGFTPA